MRQSIRGYADGLIALASPGGEVDLSTLASELSAIRGVLAASEDLSRALADPGIELVARRAVVHDLFEGKVSATTLRMLDFVLNADRATDTVENFDWLAERFDAAQRGLTPIGDTVLGTKGAEERLDGYASAVLETITGRDALADLEDELFRFSRVVAGSDELRDALTDRDRPAANRRQIVVDLLQGKASPTAVRLAGYITHTGRPRDFEALLGGLIDRIASESNRRLADVRSALSLDDAQQQQLAAALGRVIGREVEVRVTVDPSVVAGFVATIGDTVVDGSARHQLEILKERLVSPEAITTGERH